MDASEVLDGLVEFGKQDWLALWMIVDDVEAELEPDDDEDTLELTLALANCLLDRGVLVLSLCAAVLHRWIDQRMQRIREL